MAPCKQILSGYSRLYFAEIYMSLTKTLRYYIRYIRWVPKFRAHSCIRVRSLDRYVKEKQEFRINGIESMEAKISFENSLEQLLCASLLHNPVFTHFSIQRDASQFGVGAVLVQRNENAEEVPSAYKS